MLKSPAAAPRKSLRWLSKGKAEGDVLHVLRQAVDWQETNGPLPPDWYGTATTDPEGCWRLQEWIAEMGRVEAVDEPIIENIRLLERREAD
jgi:hypothetical protein